MSHKSNQCKQIKIVLNDGSGCDQLKMVFSKCKDYTCGQSKENEINTDDLMDITTELFSQLNQKISISLEQSGGGNGHIDIDKPEEPSSNLFDGTPVSDVKILYVNMRKYMKLHKIVRLTEEIMIPYGIILSALNLPDDITFLHELYPDFVQYLSKNKIIDHLTDQTPLPIVLFLNEIDIHNINHLKMP